MKFIIAACAIFISTASWAAKPATEVQLRKLGPDSYEATMTTSETSDVAVAQNALAPGAEQLCGDKKPRFGHYAFNTTEPLNKTEGGSLPILTLKQEIFCEAASASPPAQNAPTSQWTPTSAQEENIKSLSRQYFNSRDSGLYEAAYLLFSAPLKASINKKTWLEGIKQFNIKAGSPVSRQLTKLTWYNNASTSPNPGIYAAADFINQFDNIDTHCGFLIWQLQEAGGFLLVREEENFIDKTTQATMTDSDLAKVKAQYGCVVR